MAIARARQEARAERSPTRQAEGSTTVTAWCASMSSRRFPHQYIPQVGDRRHRNPVELVGLYGDQPGGAARVASKQDYPVACTLFDNPDRQCQASDSFREAFQLPNLAFGKEEPVLDWQQHAEQQSHDDQ